MKQVLTQARRYIVGALFVGGVAQAAVIPLSGLDGRVSVDFDLLGQAVVKATSQNDACQVLGYLHAKDRLFQMDFLRRASQGTLATLTGSAALPNDVQLRTLGLGRGAAASLAAFPPDVLECLEAYADGVNALITAAPALPPEYGALELTKAGIPPWTPLDSSAIAKLLAFQLGISLVDIDRTVALLTLQAVGEGTGFDGTAAFFDEMWRVAPFDPAVSIPGFFDENGVAKASGGIALAPGQSKQRLLAQLKDLHGRIDANPLLRSALKDESSEVGSNWFIASGSVTESGYPLLANDPHLDLGNAPIFWPVAGVDVDDPLAPSWASGVMFPGAPIVAQGCNSYACYGSTVNRTDVADIFNASLVIDPDLGLPVAYIVNDEPRPLMLIPQIFEVNAIGDGVDDTIVNSGIGPADPGGITFIAPDFGPAVNVDFSDPMNVTALFLKSPIDAPTQEIPAFMDMRDARTPAEFHTALEKFDMGSQNWAFANSYGDIAYFTMAEIPLRYDLQNGFVKGLGPGFIRDGNDPETHWLPVDVPEANQALGSAILPYDELPFTVNPPQGYIINANNDPVGSTLDNNPYNQLRRGGNGIYYLNEGASYAGGYRQARAQHRIHEILHDEDRLLTLDDFASIQGDTVMHDAKVFVPHILQAFENAQNPSAELPLQAMLLDPRVIEAVGRLAAWDFSTPTGIPDGFDFGDDPAALPAPTDEEVANSVAATLYSMWRGNFINNTFDSLFRDLGGFISMPDLGDDVLPNFDRSLRGMRYLLENFEEGGGAGPSSLWYFRGPGMNNVADARDFNILFALMNSLNDAASPAFGPAFGESTDQNDYQWGKLHRIIFEHPLGGVEPLLNIPAGASSSDDIVDGFATDGGLFTLDRSDPSSFIFGPNDGLFSAGPARRFLGEFFPQDSGGIAAWQVIPGGVSGIPDPANPAYANQLPLWLTNRNFPLPTSNTVFGLTPGDEFIPVMF